MTPRFEFRWLMILLVTTCFCASSVFADDAPKTAPAPNAPSSEQVPKITPGPSAPKPDTAAPAPDAKNSTDAPIVREYPDLPYSGFNFGYGYRPLGYAFWPRYDHYADFAMPYFADPYRYYRQPYQWHPFWSWQRYRQFGVYDEF